MVSYERRDEWANKGQPYGLALCLVDGHAKGWPRWELPAPELEWKRCVCQVGVAAGNENNFANAATSYYLSFDDMRVDLAYQHPGANGLSKIQNCFHSPHHPTHQTQRFHSSSGAGNSH